MSNETKPGGLYGEIDTPALLVDLDIVEANLAALARAAAERKVGLRPHIKTHKSAYFAHRQMAHGAVGVTVAKIGEAEVMVDAGITDILLAYPPIGPIKLRRLGALLERARIKVSLDSLEAAVGLSELARDRQQVIEVYIDIDTGLHRMGLEPGEPSARLAAKVHELPFLEVVGVMSHCGHIGKEKTPEAVARGAREDAELLVETARLARKYGVPIRVVSPGSTPGSLHHLQVEGVTEIRPGTYLFNDCNCIGAGSATIDECAATVLATVVSRPSPDRAVVDAGSKTLAADLCAHRPGHGIVKGYPEVVVARLSEEHGVLSLPDPGIPLAVGDRMEIIPNHICPVVNLSDSYVAVRRGRVVGEIPVSARGKRQ